MKQYIRFEYDGKPRFGILDGDVARCLDMDFLNPAAAVTGEALPLNRVRLLPPVIPPNILAIGLNYRPHAAEANMTLPKIPLIFIKATTSLTGNGDAILLPRIAPDEVDYEGELAIVVGRRAKNVSEADADGYIFGYTVANDVSARDCQIKIDTQWARGKSFDTFCPVGPAVVAGLDADHLAIETRLNGQVMQSSNTDQLIFSARKLVSFCSRNMTLEPGTLILTGTPQGVGFTRNPPVYLRAGDVVEISVEGIGTLRNPVEAEA